ncbi:hypothetical protein IT417_03770 [bacterium]|nr:hypothetical protein [bacterium]
MLQSKAVMPRETGAYQYTPPKGLEIFASEFKPSEQAITDEYRQKCMDDNKSALPVDLTEELIRNSWENNFPYNTVKEALDDPVKVLVILRELFTRKRESLNNTKDVFLEEDIKLPNKILFTYGMYFAHIKANGIDTGTLQDPNAEGLKFLVESTKASNGLAI